MTVDELNEEKPKGAQFYIDGLFYKLGVHDFVFVYMGSVWVKSSNTKSELYAMVRQQEVLTARAQQLKERRTIYNRQYKQAQEAKRKRQKNKKRKEIISRKARGKQ